MKTCEIKEAFGIDALQFTERPDPPLQQGQVRVRVRAVSLNYRDLMTVKHGGGARTVRLPLIPCSDGAGEVVEVGPGVTRVKVGDRVAGTFFQSWLAGSGIQVMLASKR